MTKITTYTQLTELASDKFCPKCGFRLGSPSHLFNCDKLEKEWQRIEAAWTQALQHSGGE